MPARGTLTPERPAVRPGGAGAGPAAFRVPSRRPACLCDQRDACTVTAFDYDPGRGSLSRSRPSRRSPRDSTGKGYSTAEVQVHPSGRFLYGSNRGHDTHRDLRDRRRHRPAPAGRPPVHSGEDSAELRHRPDGPLPAGGEPGFRHRRRLPDRPAVAASSSRPGKRSEVPKAVCVKFVPMGD